VHEVVVKPMLGMLLWYLKSGCGHQRQVSSIAQSIDKSKA
jgi:hypothetical protein